MVNKNACEGSMPEEKKFRFLTPIDKYPSSFERRRPSVYGEIIEEFMNSDLQYAEVNDCGRSPTTMYVGLRKYLKKAGNQKVRVLLKRKDGKVFIVREENPP
jgi:hypothetical protein